MVLVTEPKVNGAVAESSGVQSYFRVYSWGYGGKLAAQVQACLLKTALFAFLDQGFTISYLESTAPTKALGL